MKSLAPVTARLGALAERMNSLSLRERGLIFAAGVTLVYIAWQTLLMAPLAERGRIAEQHLADARQQLATIEQAGAAIAADPVVTASARNRALKQRLAELEAKLNSAAHGYLAPQQATELLRQLLAEQHGLTLVSLENLPIENLSQAPGGTDAAPITTGAIAGPGSGADGRPANDCGPFLHPVEIVVDGNYASVVAYLRAIENLPYKLHWQQLQLTTAEYPVNRVRIVIGALSLSRDWIRV